MNSELQDILKRYSYRLLAVQSLILLGILCLSLGSSYFVKKNLAIQVTQMVEGQIKQSEYKEALFMLSSAKQQNFIAIGYFDREGNRLFTLPADLSPSFFSERSLFEKLIHATVSIDILSGPGRLPFGKIVYVFDDLSILLIGVLLWAFATLVSMPFLAKYKKLVIESFEKQAAAKRSEISEQIAAQVQHDVRSPVQALSALAEVSKGLSEFERQCLCAATTRIEQIVADLAALNKVGVDIGLNEASETSLVSVVIPLYEVFREKVVQNMPRSKIKFELNLCDDPLHLHSKINESVFKRVISNILANSIEAIETEGLISINLETLDDQRIQIKIIDSGQGIPKDLIEKLGKKGGTFGKLNGSGFGLYYAKTKMQSWGGEFKIESQEGYGTEVTLILKRDVIAKDTAKDKISKSELSDFDEILNLDVDRANSSHSINH